MKIKTQLLKKHIADYICKQINDFEIDENKIMEIAAIKLLEEIQKILKNNSYSDFEMIEKIITLFEKNNIDYGSCHDF